MVMLFMVSYMFVQVFFLATIAAFDPSGRAGAAAAGLLVLLVGFGAVLGGLLITAGSYATLGRFAIGVCGTTALLVLLLGRSLDHPGATPHTRFSSDPAPVMFMTCLSNVSRR